MKAVTSFLFLAFILASGCINGINGPIAVGDNITRTGSLGTVNGSVSIGSNCHIKGSVSSVNGGIHVGKASDVGALDSVNGGISLAQDVRVDGDVKSINGSVTCEKNVLINGDINTVNGRIHLTQTTVTKNIETYNGDIILAETSTVSGNIIVGRTGRSNNRQTITIRIGDGSVVKGDIEVRTEQNKVQVYLSGGGKVLGEIRGAETME